MEFAPLPEAVLDEVLDRLGLASRPDADLAGLQDVYGAWCRNVPFDNLRKLVALHYDMPELPGIDPADFFAAWLVTGAGGTCWPSNNGLHALLRGLGFDARRHGAAMLDAPDVNHGTTIVHLEGRRWMVDTAMLTGSPLPLDDGVTARVDHAGWVVTATPEEAGWLVHFPTPDPVFRMPCRIGDEIEAADTATAYEQSREFSVFNDVVSCHAADDRGVWLLRDDQIVRIDRTGTAPRTATVAEVDAFLADVVGHSPQLIAEVRGVLEERATTEP